MSNLSGINEQAQDCEAHPCDAIELVIHPKEKDIGDFSVRRVLPAVQKRMVGPWLFFDHMGPANFPAGKGINVRPHPHINLATVTYLFEGEILHRDSLGYEETIIPGDVNLMVAGKGITHSERERDEVRNQPHTLHGLQLWLALPAEDEEVDPAFHHYPAADIPGKEVDGVPLRVLIGSAYGLTSPVKTFADTLYVEAHLQPGQSIELPLAEERAVYVASGHMEAKDSQMEVFSMTVFSQGPGIVITAKEESRIAIVGGEKMAPRHLFWNFSSTRPERIEQAKEDWKNGKFPKVPGDEEEFIPLP